jgi:hypothetical protein
VVLAVQALGLVGPGDSLGVACVGCSLGVLACRGLEVMVLLCGTNGTLGGLGASIVAEGSYWSAAWRWGAGNCCGGHGCVRVRTIATAHVACAWIA